MTHHWRTTARGRHAGATILWRGQLLDKDEKPVVGDPSVGVTLQVVNAAEDVEIQAEASLSLVAEDLGKEVTSATATTGAAETLTDSARAWTVDGFVDYVVRITAGTGSGQQRRVKSNTATVLTVTKAWTVNPDNTSVYSVTRRFYEYAWASPVAQAEKVLVGVFRAKDAAYTVSGKLPVYLEVKV